MYRCICIDATYYLRRNWYVIKNRPGFDKSKLIGLFLMSVLKFYRSFPADKVILLFDKSPYRKMEVIKEYKTDRYRVMDHKKELEDKLSAAKTEEEKAAINKELDPVKKEAELFKVIGDSKYDLLANFGKFGIVSLNEVGFEADDLAYYLSLAAQEEKMKILLVSGDEDWICFANEYTDVYRGKTKDPELFDYNKVLLKYKPYSDIITPFEFYQIKDIYCGGHNNVILDFDRDKYSLDEVVRRIANNDTEDIKKFKDYYDALNIKRYYNELRDKVIYAMKRRGRLDFSAWDSYYNREHPAINRGAYSSTLMNLSKDLYLE